MQSSWLRHSSVMGRCSCRSKASISVGGKGMSRLEQLRLAACHASNSACWTSGRVSALASAPKRVLPLRRMVHSPHRISTSVSSGCRNARQEEPLFAKLKPPDTEAPSAGAIRASLDSSTSIPCFPFLKKTSRETSEEAPVLTYPCLPHVQPASVFATDTAFCCFKRGRKGRYGLAEHANHSLRCVEFETVAKADCT